MPKCLVRTIYRLWPEVVVIDRLEALRIQRLRIDILGVIGGRFSAYSSGLLLNLGHESPCSEHALAKLTNNPQG